MQNKYSDFQELHIAPPLPRPFSKATENPESNKPALVTEIPERQKGELCENLEPWCDAVSPDCKKEQSKKKL